MTSSRIAALALFAWASVCVPARAQDSPPEQGNFLSDTAKSAGEMARSAGEAVGGWWQDLTGPPGPSGYLPNQISEEDRRLFAIFDAIGLKLTDVVVSKGLFSGATYRFAATREPTDDDVQRAESLLRSYREDATGVLSRARQRIARGTLDAIANAGYSLASMEVSFWPWPDASYHVTARPSRAAPLPGQAGPAAPPAPDAPPPVSPPSAR
ncbi:MAG: hypothetical protein AB7F35_15675 [Acetobacteraceae bacterium]